MKLLVLLIKSLLGRSSYTLFQFTAAVEELIKNK